MPRAGYLGPVFLLLAGHKIIVGGATGLGKRTQEVLLKLMDSK